MLRIFFPSVPIPFACLKFVLILNLIQQVFGQDKDLIFPIYFVVFHFKFLHMISKLLFSEKIKAKKEQIKNVFHCS